MPMRAAMCHAAPFVILDEPTAAVISHRLARARIADGIVVVDRGRIFEEGPRTN